MSADRFNSGTPLHATPEGWSLLHDLHAHRLRAAVCVSAAVVDGVHRGEGDYVGYVVAFNGDYEGTFTLAGMTFRTTIKWSDVRGAWRRHEAPNPCACGRTYSPEEEGAAST